MFTIYQTFKLKDILGIGQDLSMHFYPQVVLKMQVSIFKIMMKSNAIATMEVPFHANPLTRLWRTLEASCILRHSFLEIFKLVKIAIVQMLGLVEDEWTFSTLYFIKSKLRYRFNEDLQMVVGMYSKKKFIINTFPYDTCFND